jgi:hypothetical protein
MGSNCENLDAYLLGDLDRDETVRFEQHLGTCAACQRTVDQQRWLDDLLQSPLRADLEPPPDSLVQSIRVSLARRRSQRRLAACGLAAAAALIVAMGWTLWAGRHARMNPAEQIAQSHGEAIERQNAGGSPSARPQPPDSDTAFTKAAVVGDERTIVVPVESPYPNVTVVRVYPVYQPKYAAQATTSRQKAPDEFAWPEHINGG